MPSSNAYLSVNVLDFLERIIASSFANIFSWAGSPGKGYFSLKGSAISAASLALAFAVISSEAFLIFAA